MGGPASPSVFHTTPPQPALKARTTLYSLSVGGAEASQNGFGDLMPTKLVRRSAMSVPLLNLWGAHNHPQLRRAPQDEEVSVLHQPATPLSARLIDSAATLPSSTATTVRSLPPAAQSPPAHTPASEVRRSASTLMRPASSARVSAVPLRTAGTNCWPIALNTMSASRRKVSTVAGRRPSRSAVD